MMKEIRILYLLLAVLIIPVSGLSSQEIDNDIFTVNHGPYLQNLGEDGVTIIWTTNKPAVPGVSLTGPDGKTTFIRNSNDGIVDGGGVLHKVRINGLESGKDYRYSINSVQILKYQAYRVYYGDTLKGKTTAFKTLSDTPGKVRFTVINDVHDNSGKMASYLKNGCVAEQDLFIFNGDMVDFLQHPDQLYPGFLDTAVAYFASQKPFFYARGNHETRGYKARELKDFFDFRDNKFYYSFDYGPVHFTILDCGEDKPDNNKNYFGLADYDTYRMEELEWLKNEVRSEKFRNSEYRIIIIHMPVIKEENQVHAMKFLSDNFGPVLHDSRVDLMICAHTHRNTYYEKGESGFGYPVLVNSNNSFVQVSADSEGIIAKVKDTTGQLIKEYKIK